MSIEYKHVRFDYGITGSLDSTTFDERLTAILREAGSQGWELRGTFHDFGFHAHMIFMRKEPEGEES